MYRKKIYFWIITLAFGLLLTGCAGYYSGYGYYDYPYYDYGYGYYPYGYYGYYGFGHHREFGERHEWREHHGFGGEHRR